MSDESQIVIAVRGPGLVLAIVCGVASGCGFFLDDTERLERARQAYEAADYRAAMIDAKSILRQEPGNADARVLLGKSSLELGDAVSAEKEFRRAIDLGVSHSDIAAVLGRSMLMLRQFDAVLDEIDPAIATDPLRQRELRRIRGDALLGLNRPVEARAVFGELLVAAPDDLESMLAIVSSYIMEGHIPQARATLDEIIGSNVDYHPAWLASGSLWILQKNFTQSEDDFERALKIAVAGDDRGGEIKALSGLIEAQLVQQKLAAARAGAERLAVLAPNSISAYYLAARISFLERDWRGAQNRLHSILRQDPNYRPAQVLLGAVYLNRGNYGQAEIYLAAAIAAMPSNLDARKLLAETRMRQKKAFDAAEVLGPAIDSGNADSGTLAMAARAKLSYGDVEGATDLLQRRIAADPENTGLYLDLAAALVSVGEIEKAREILQRDSVLSGKDAYRREFLFVITQYRNDEYDAALDGAARMLERWPEDAHLHSLAGGMQLLAGKRREARISFETAARLDPSNVATTINLVRVDIADGDMETGKRRLLEAHEAVPDDAGIQIAIARLAAATGEVDDAILWSNSAIETDRRLVGARIMLCRLYISEGRFEEGEAAARTALDEFDAVAELQSLLARSLAGQDEYRGALLPFERAIKLDPENVLYRMNLANAYVELGDNDRAELVLRQSLEMNPDDIRTNSMLAKLRAGAGDMRGALEVASAFKDRNPGNAESYVLFADMLAQDDKLTEASAAYDDALRLDNNRDIAMRAFRLRVRSGLPDRRRPLRSHLDTNPEADDVRMVLAQDYQVQREFGLAAEEYRRIIEASPGNHVAMNNLAWVYLELGDPRAEDLARSAHALAPRESSVIDTLGWILVQQGELAPGIEFLRKAVRLSGGSNTIRLHLASALADAGQTAEAERILREILSGDDEFTGRHEARSLLRDL